MNIEGVLDFQIDLELRIASIYQRIGDQLSCKISCTSEEAGLWKKLARDERKHAALLKIEKALLQTGTRVKSPVELSDETKRKIETMVSKYETQISRGINEGEALQILNDLETCDEALFQALLKATDSKFLSQFAQHSQTCQAHEKRVQESLRSYEQQTARQAKKETTDV